MARDFNQIRNTNAKLVNATIDKYGASYPAQSPWRADGFNKIFVETEGANPTQKDFLEGNSSVYVYAIGSNISSLLPYSLASFTNIKELYLFSPTMVNIGAIDNDYLTYLTDSDLKVYVPSSKLQSYINAYGGTGKHLENRFDEITDDYPLTVSGSGDLTSQELTNQLMNNYESVDRTNCTKLIIQGFTNASSVIWGYDFSEILPNLNSNIWVNGVKFDFSVLNIVGSGTLTEVDIDNAISDIAISNRGGVLEVKISGYSDMSFALEYDYEDLPNLEYVWLYNVRYENVSNTYQSVEYIESTGTQYIDTGFTLPWNTNITISDYEFDSAIFECACLPDNSSTRFFGHSGNSSRGNLSCGFNKQDSKILIASTNSFEPIQTTVSSVYDYHKIELSNGFQKVDNIEVSNNQYPNYFERSSNNPTNKLLIFIGVVGWSTALPTGSSTKLKSAQFKKNNVLLRDFIPCYRKADNVAGLYDLVNGVFYTNQGTGTFSKGNDIDKYIWSNKTYFYPISTLEQEYDDTKEQTFYLDYNGTLPSYPNYQLTYYTDINCTTTILPENMQSGTRYYAKAVMVTLTIQGSGTLTSAIVENAVSKAGSGVTKVTIPVEFTTYDSGTITQLQNALPNLRYLETCYEAGNMELDLQGTIYNDINIKITSLGSTFDTEIVKSRSFSYINNGSFLDNPNTTEFLNLMIVPPLNRGGTNFVFWHLNNKNVYAGKQKGVFQSTSYIGGGNKLIYAEIEVINSSNKTLLTTSSSTPTTSLKYLLVPNFETDLNISNSTAFTRQSLVDLINSLGTPSTQKTLTIGATNLAKLTAEDIAIATAKGWVVQ